MGYKNDSTSKILWRLKCLEANFTSYDVARYSAVLKSRVNYFPGCLYKRHFNTDRARESNTLCTRFAAVVKYTIRIRHGKPLGNIRHIVGGHATKIVHSGNNSH